MDELRTLLPWIGALLTTVGVVVAWRGFEAKGRKAREDTAYARGRRAGLLDETVRRLDKHVEHSQEIHRDIFTKLESVQGDMREIKGGIRRLLNGGARNGP